MMNKFFTLFIFGLLVSQLVFSEYTFYGYIGDYIDRILQDRRLNGYSLSIVETSEYAHH